MFVVLTPTACGRAISAHGSAVGRTDTNRPAHADCGRGATRADAQHIQRKRAKAHVDGALPLVVGVRHGLQVLAYVKRDTPTRHT